MTNYYQKVAYYSKAPLCEQLIEDALETFDPNFIEMVLSRAEQENFVIPNTLLEKGLTYDHPIKELFAEWKAQNIF